MQKISPMLWFDNQAEEAAEFYVSVFKNSKILSKSYYQEGGPAPAGSLMICHFELEGKEFTALNAGPMFKFTEAISFVVACEDQAEIDELWSKLTADGGADQPCGWLKDKYGLSWQLTPKTVIDMITDADTEKAKRAFQAVMGMMKIDIAAVRKAFEG